MGNWNRRYLPRRKYRHSEYEDPTIYENISSSSRVEDTRVPLWEINYCNSVRVPWNKVLATKKYFYCYPSVLSWDDSAGKQAFDNAKQRYWAMTSGYPYDNPLPDPNMFIDEIDWNPCMDPELMEDLDRQFYNPDEEHNVDKLETINKEAQIDKNQTTSENPWEMNNVQGTENPEGVDKGWSRWDDSVNSNKDNPWVQSVNPLDDFLGRGEINSWSWCYENANGNNSRNFGYSGCPWEDNYSSGPKDRSRICGNGWRDSEDSRRFRRGGRTFRGGFRKRETSLEHSSKYKNSRY
ncbi:hypothetical protein ACJIZ3_018565 [Penstemon smallii]|uniref:Uncharacterized protein n=1 Tax=Penstemon smallii TaxID=265156 RepID=A0ABD3SZA9_9LAMI